MAAADEVGDQPVGVLLLDRAWVLVRLGGEVRAFEDRCPHRLAPLSAGSVAGGRLVCRYHGWAFDDGGACTLIPANGDGGPIPSRACLARPAGVVERYGLVWLAPEAPVCDLHDFPEWDDPAFVRAATAPRRTSAGALQLADNFLDAAHFPTVHTQTFGTPEAAYVSPHEVERRGWEVRTTYHAPYRNHDDPLVDVGRAPADPGPRAHEDRSPRRRRALDARLPGHRRATGHPVRLPARDARPRPGSTSRWPAAGTAPPRRRPSASPS